MCEGDKVIMTFIGEAIIGEFISKVSDSIVEISKAKIKEAVKNRKDKHQSPESQIYNIMVDVLNKITYGEYENDQDKIYDAAEKILKSFKSGIDNSENNIKLGLSEICENVDENKCIDFMKLIYRELSKENYSELYREIRLLQYEKEGNKTSRIGQKVDEIQNGVQEINERLNKIETNKYNSIVDQGKIVKKESRTQEYANKWNTNMFLNDFDEWDENAGVNVILSDVYFDKHLPHFIYGNNKKESTDLKKFLTRYIETKSQNEMLLILGQPGIGKSTLITWITAHFTEKVDDILVYRFASDLKNIEWKSENITERILKELGLSNEELNEKILIFDGYDEIGVKDDRKEILDQLYWGLVKNNTIKCFSLIVTCRVNYIKGFERVQSNYITLQSWDKEQIKSFCNIFCRITNISLDTEAIENIIKNKEILGVPLILYMVLALNISIDKEGSIVDVYDKIFSLEGGIYDRCIDNKSFADRHRVGKMKKQIHQISRDIAIWMFENNPDEAYVPAEEYKKICSNIAIYNGQNEKDIEQDSIIGNFFELKHCEGRGTEKLYFVHRSIYEYFVAETMYNVIKIPIKEMTIISQERFSVISFYLKDGIITKTICEYLCYKIEKNNCLLGKTDNNKLYCWIELSVDRMLDKGMFFYTKFNIQKYENIIRKEVNCFTNILKILRTLLNISMSDYILQLSVQKVERYIKYSILEYKLASNKKVEPPNFSKMFLKEIKLDKVNLSGIDLREANLNHASLIDSNLEKADLRRAILNKTFLIQSKLRGANLEETNLQKAHLIKADLREANLEGADLREACLMGADLRGANLRGANLMFTKFDEEQITYLLNYDLSKSLVYVEECGGFIDYLKYQNNNN